MLGHLRARHLVRVDEIDQHLALVDEGEDGSHGTDLTGHEFVAATRIDDTCDYNEEE